MSSRTPAYFRLYFTLIPFILVALLSCEEEKEQRNSYLREPKNIELGSNEDSRGVSSSSSSDKYTPDKKQVPRIRVSPEEQIIQILEVNLDLDRNDEQILAVKNTQEGESSIRLLVADYDSIRDKYIKAWETETSANSRRSFNVSVIDVTGDHSLEILCNGMTVNGHQTMDIYRRTTSPKQLGVYYESILSLAVKGTIELKDEKRSQSYQKGLKSGVGFPVVTTTRDQDASRLGELTKTTHVWRSGSNRYRKVKTEKIPGQEIEDKRLRELFTGDKKQFKGFLDGPWLLTETGNTPSTRYLIHFGSQSGLVTLYSGSIQESYEWNNTYRFLAESLSISGENTIVPFMRIYLTVHVVDLSTVRITIYDVNSHNGSRKTNTTWSGTYQKVGSSMQKSFLRLENNENAVKDMPTLTGVYKNDAGTTFYFDPPRFRLEEEGKTIRGGFSTYRMGADILELKVVDEKGLVQERRCYSFDYLEERKENAILRKLVLRPGEILRTGFFPHDDATPLIFQQREVIEEEEE